MYVRAQPEEEVATHTHRVHLSINDTCTRRVTTEVCKQRGGGQGGEARLQLLCRQCTDTSSNCVVAQWKGDERNDQAQSFIRISSFLLFICLVR
jgi:hypothetical protein